MVHTTKIAKRDKKKILKRFVRVNVAPSKNFYFQNPNLTHHYISNWKFFANALHQVIFKMQVIKPRKAQFLLLMNYPDYKVIGNLKK